MRAFLAAAVVLGLTGQASAQIPVRVRVDHPTSPDGFKQPLPAEYEESVRDLVRLLAKDKSLHLVETDEESAAIVVVTSRSSYVERTGGAVMMPMGSTIMAVPTKTHRNALNVEVRAGEHATPFAANCRAWPECAKTIVKPIQAWLTANADLLVKR